MFNIGDLVIYNNSYEEHMAEIISIYPDTDEYMIEFSRSDIIPNKMIAHESVLEKFTPYGYDPRNDRKCECGSHKVYGINCGNSLHDTWCPIYRRK